MSFFAAARLLTRLLLPDTGSMLQVKYIRSCLLHIIALQAESDRLRLVT
jgi:hypothetical protein